MNEEACKAARDLEPMSIFISQHLYVRRGFEPIFDTPVKFATRIAQSARLFLLPRPTLEAILLCDGAWSRWSVGIQMWACAIRMTSPAGIGMETKPRCPATWLVERSGFKLFGG